jgi:hypothetical protein
MCTVTVLPPPLLPDNGARDPLLLRVVCNRDELLTRAAALPPTTWAAGARQAVMPIDPRSGGTWVAANDAGLVFVLLNTHDGLTVRTGEVSRGTIVPALVSCGTISLAVAQMQRFDAARFAPFQLLILDRDEAVDCWPDGDRIRVRHSRLRGAILRTSSGLGDAVATGPRRTLFNRLLNSAPDACVAQDHFHRHRWPGREAISVDMRRPDARTVSRTVVEVRDASVRLSYQALEWPHAVTVQVAA